MKNTLVTVTVVFLFCSTLMAQGDDASTRKSLKGILGVWVVIEPLDPDAERTELSRNAIQTDVELRLRMAGIAILPGDKTLAWMRGGPALYIVVHTHKRGELYAFSYSIGLYQRVKLDREPQISLFASTWGGEGLGSVGSANLSQIRNRIKDAVDKFINAWLSVNPKP